MQFSKSRRRKLLLTWQYFLFLIVTIPKAVNDIRVFLRDVVKLSVISLQSGIKINVINKLKLL